MWNATASRKSTTCTRCPCASSLRRSSFAAPSWPAPIDAETISMLRRTSRHTTGSRPRGSGSSRPPDEPGGSAALPDGSPLLDEGAGPLLKVLAVEHLVAHRRAHLPELALVVV